MLRYKALIILAIPIWIVAITMIVVATQFPTFNRVVITSVFGGAFILGILWIILRLRSWPELYEWIDYYESSPGKEEDTIEPFFLREPPTVEQTPRNIKRIRQVMTLAGIVVPILLCGLTVFVVQFAIDLNLRYYEYVSIYVNTSAPYMASLLLFALTG
jgi:hypothetical protein